MADIKHAPKSQQVATVAAIRRIAELTAQMSTGKRRQEALDHLKRLDAEAK